MNPLIESLSRHAKLYPQQPALVGDEKSYSYQALLTAIYSLADQLQDNEIRTLALVADNGPDWVVFDLACQLADCCFIPLPLFFTAAQLQHSLQHAGVDTVVLNKGIQLGLSGDPLTLIDGYSEAFTVVRLPVSHAVEKPTGTCKITFTSGSTGQPKGVCLTQQCQIDVADSLVSTIAIEQPRHLSVLPLATLLENIAGVYAPILAGGSVFLPSLRTLGFEGSSQLDGKALLSRISQIQPTSFILIPQLLEVLIQAVNQGWTLPSSVEFIAVGGSRISAPAIISARQSGLPVYEGYGLSECASVVSLNSPKQDQPGSAGRPLPHVTIEPVHGELIVKGHCFLGYLGQPDSWYPTEVATGDLGHIDDQAFLHLNGRKKNLLISSYGRNICPEWIESELLAHPIIQQCVVFGDARPYCCALIYSANQQLSNTDIQAWLQGVNKQLPDYARIQAWLRLEQPITHQQGLLTANLRPKREAIYQHFRASIDQLYSSNAESFNHEFFPTTAR